MIRYLVVACVALHLVVWQSLQDHVSCVIESASKSDVDGYYVATGGVYIKRGGYLGTTPDLYHIYDLHHSWSSDTYVIAQDKHDWGIFALSPHRRKVYHSTTKDSLQYIFTPPPHSWANIESGETDSLVVHHCQGSLADSSPLVPPTRRSNLEVLSSRPVAAVLCAFLIFVFYQLWSNRTDVSLVSFSYDSVVVSGEYWRAISASFSHFDLLHIGFNVMSLYQLGELEEVYGSATFAYLNADLVVLTMVVCCGMYHVLIYRFNKQHLISQQAVGFSCVLFAWMVAAAVRMEKYCPLFFMPSLCFSTYILPIPSWVPTLPVNLGPFVLLVATKFILPRSSLTGHLAGIIVGFPLAWGMLSWITPPVLAAGLAIFWILSRNLLVWRFPGYSLQFSQEDLRDFVPENSLLVFLRLKIVTIVLAFITVVLVPYFFLEWSVLGFLQGLLPRVLMLVLAASSVAAVRCEWLTDLRSSQLDCACVVALSSVYAIFLCIIDSLTLTGLVTARRLVIASLTSGGRPWKEASSLHMWGGFVVCFCIICEGALSFILLRALQNMPVFSHYLQSMQLDRASVDKVMATVGLASSTAAYSGRSMTTGHAPTTNSPRTQQSSSEGVEIADRQAVSAAAISRISALPDMFTGKGTGVSSKSGSRQKANSTPLNTSNSTRTSPISL